MKINVLTATKERKLKIEYRSLDTHSSKEIAEWINGWCLEGITAKAGGSYVLMHTKSQTSKILKGSVLYKLDHSELFYLVSREHFQKYVQDPLIVHGVHYDGTNTREVVKWIHLNFPECDARSGGNHIRVEVPVYDPILGGYTHSLSVTILRDSMVYKCETSNRMYYCYADTFHRAYDYQFQKETEV